MNQTDPIEPTKTSIASNAGGQVVNPYQPVLVDDATVPAEYQPASLYKTAVRWLLVCSVSAVPSFAIAYMMIESKAIGMAAGIGVFIVGYTMLDYFTSEMHWRSNKSIRRTLKITYGTRISISIIFPVGGVCDIYTGLLSTVLTQAIAGKQFTRLAANEVTSAFLATLIHGCSLNLVLAVYGLVVFAIVKAFEA